MYVCIYCMYIPFHIFKINYNGFKVIVNIFFDGYIYLYIYNNICIIFLQFFIFDDLSKFKIFLD